MKIGIVGLGVVGKAYYNGLKKIGYKVIKHDKKLKSRIQDLIETKVTFICVSTPSKKNGECDVSQIHNVLEELSVLNYKGIAVISSTLIPGSTDKFIKKFKNLKIVNVPELLRERFAKKDFINPKVIVIGSKNNKTFKVIFNIYRKLTKNIIMMKPYEAELFKYFNNTFASIRIIFANIFYELCKKNNSNYSLIKNTYIKTGKAKDIYLNVNKKLRGYGGVCLPKDTLALAKYIKKSKLDYDLIHSIHSDNKKIKTTVFKGMRLKS